MVTAGVPLPPNPARLIEGRAMESRRALQARCDGAAARDLERGEAARRAAT
jgi:hypothetical protein